MKFDSYERSALLASDHGIEITKLLDPFVDKKDGKIVFLVEATNLKCVDNVLLS